MKKTLKKIKTFFKKRKKIFKPILFYVGSIFSLIPIACIVGIIATGGLTNFIERAKFEYIVWNDQHSLCSKPSWPWSGYGEFSKYHWTANTQFIDYFKYKPYSVVKKVVGLKDETLYNFDQCAAIGYLLKAAHQDSKIAKVILASLPKQMGSGLFGQYYDDLFKRYLDSLEEKKLYNPALVNAFANKLDKKDDYLYDLEKRRKLHKKAAEEGYLLGMEDYLLTFLEKEKSIDKSECPFVLKYSNHLYEQNALLPSYSFISALIGKTSDYHTRAIYECSDKKKDFAKYILLLKNFHNKLKKFNSRPALNIATTYPALIYFNGWGNVEKDQKLAHELFSINNEGDHASDISKAYLSLIELNNSNTTNHKEGLKLLNEILDSKVSSYGEPSKYIYCNNIKYDFKIPEVKKESNKEKQARVTEYLKPLKSCLNKASTNEKIDSVKSFIKSWIEDWFKNPELVKTLNLYG